ncbi:MAG: hypothetical protein ACRD26_21250 [Vicinamibacterales bacterium]
MKAMLPAEAVSTTHASDSYEQVFTRPVVNAGRLTLLVSIPLSFLPVVYLWMRHGLIPPWDAILTGWFLIASIYGFWYVIEPISYFPVLGTAGTYMAFLSGNIANMRVPCSAVAQEALGVEPGTKKAELVATLGIGGSIATNLIVVTLGALAGNVLIDFIPPIVVSAFEYVLPAIFGALFVMFAIKYPRYGAFAIAITLLLLGVVRVLPAWIVIPITIFSTILVAAGSYRRTSGGR